MGQMLFDICLVLLMIISRPYGSVLYNRIYHLIIALNQASMTKCCHVMINSNRFWYRYISDNLSIIHHASLSKVTLLDCAICITYTLYSLFVQCIAVWTNQSLKSFHTNRHVCPLSHEKYLLWF